MINIKKIVIFNDKNSFSVKDEQIIDLEIKLNLTNKYLEWSYLGDFFYNYYTNLTDQKIFYLNVTFEQYKFFLDLSKKSYESLFKNN